MLKELFNAVVALGQEASGIRTHTPAAEPGHVYLIRGADGTNKVQRLEAEPQPRQHRAMSLDAIVAFSEEFAKEHQRVAVWYSRAGVMAFLDDKTRRDRVDLGLTYSSQLALLMRLEGKLIWHSQQDFVRLLRVDLAGCVDTSLVGVVRKIKFRENMAGHSEVSPGKQSVGKSIERELCGVGDLPEEVCVTLPVWHGFTAGRACYTIACATDVNPATQQFALTPLPGQIEGIIRMAEADVGDALFGALDDKEHVHVYYGTP